MTTTHTQRTLRAALVATAVCSMPLAAAAQSLARTQATALEDGVATPGPTASGSSLPRTPSDAATTSGPWRREIAGGIALGHVYRFEDTTFGNRPNVMVSAGLRHRKGFGVEAEFDRTFGLRPRPAPCGILIDGVPAICVGNGRDGVESVSIASIGARYEFQGTRFKPYLLAGLGLLRSTSVWSTATVDGNRVVVTEQRLVDTGFGPDLGAGLSLDVSPRITIRPEVRWLDASVRSRLNLGTTRLGALVAYRW